ncbi:MAG: His/Gly/Thr/Pro-type tRNA ligase C-terminal domain-containing protein, partial [Desulfuromonas thiophila]|nr:His/Gly/Thr/Pro-type tRNA ligase C-terminal domain-containing protein [Desulfuromonas thiophila]
LGGPDLPGIGFAMGVERLALLLGEDAIASPPPDLFIAALGEAAARQAFIWLHQLQRAGLQADMDFSGKSLKAQMRRADKLGSRFTLVLGDDELASGQAQLKRMADGQQSPIELDQLTTQLRAALDAAAAASL